MKIILSITLITFACLALQAQDQQPPQSELSEVEKKFLGKWKGSRDVYRWEILRKADRTFEIAFTEPDPDRFLKKFKNYAVGVWWIEGKEYKFEWKQWWGDEGDFSGVKSEIIKSIEENRVVTLSEDDIDPNNIEVRIEKFSMRAWALKPKNK